MENKQKIFFIVLAIVILGVIGLAAVRGTGPEEAKGPGKYDVFTQCLAEKGAVFYGAFWCPHCRDQKEIFGSSDKYLPYVECSTLDGQGQTAACIEKNIESYPTWDFADGSRIQGKLSFEQLSEKTSCPLPSDTEEVEFDGGTSTVTPQE